MEVKRVEILDYEPPNLEIFKVSDILEKLGPTISCSGFYGGHDGNGE